MKIREPHLIRIYWHPFWVIIIKSQVYGASNKESIELYLKLAEGYKDMGENAKAIE